LSKERWEAEKSKAELDADVAEETDKSAAEDSGEDEEASWSQSGNESEDAESSSAEGGVGLHDSEDEGTHDEDESDSGDEDEDAEEEVKKPTLPTPADGTTLFIRNVPFDATEEELRTLWVSFLFLPLQLTYPI
jgi:nucleolar protein 4